MTKTIDVTAPVEQEGTKAIVKSWYVALGETIAAGDPLVELETDKVAVEVPAPVSGVLMEILIDADGEAEPGGVLGRLEEGGAAASAVETLSAQATSTPTIKGKWCDPGSVANRGRRR